MPITTATPQINNDWACNQPSAETNLFFKQGSLLKGKKKKKSNVCWMQFDTSWKQNGLHTCTSAQCIWGIKYKKCE